MRAAVRRPRRLPGGSGQRRRGRPGDHRRHRGGSGHGDGEACPPVPRRDPRGQGGHRVPHGCVQRERRVRDGAGRRGERLDRRAQGLARGADGDPPGRRRPDPHVPRQGRRSLAPAAMTVRIRRDEEIWREEGGWFTARWHFSFDRYRDPDNMGWGNMPVFNDDRLIPGAVWPLHPHRDIEGLTYVVEGTFRHEDNVGGPFGPLAAGSVQRMTLGSGALHSELNASQTEPMRFIQIWILPGTPDLEPGVEQKVFTREDRTNRLLRVIGPEGGDVVRVHQDASVHVSRLEAGMTVTHPIGEGRGVYAYLIDGAAGFDGQSVTTGDAAKITDQGSLTIEAREPSELILVDVPMRFEPVGIW